MAVYRIHTTLTEHTGQKTGRVRSCTPGVRIEAPEGEFSDLTPGTEYSRLDTAEKADDAPEVKTDTTKDTDERNSSSDTDTTD
jgi:hypothetical protein